jgi:hypothetical protein
MEVPGKLLSGKYGAVIKFFLIIPIVAIISGSLITRLFILPYTGGSEKNASNAALIKQSSSTSFEVSFVQAGVFSSKNNSQTVVNRLKQMGYMSFSISDGDLYRVIADMSKDTNALTSTLNKLKGQGYQCIIKGYNVSLLKEENDDNKLLNIYLSKLFSLHNIQYEAASSLRSNKTYNEQGIRNEFSSFKEDGGIIIDKIASANIKNSAVEFNKNIDTLNNKFIECLNNKDTMGCFQILAEEVSAVARLRDSFSQGHL